MLTRSRDWRARESCHGHVTRSLCAVALPSRNPLGLLQPLATDCLVRSAPTTRADFTESHSGGVSLHWAADGLVIQTSERKGKAAIVDRKCRTVVHQRRTRVAPKRPEGRQHASTRARRAGLPTGARMRLLLPDSVTVANKTAWPIRRQ